MGALLGVGQSLGIIVGVLVAGAFKATPFLSFVVPGVIALLRVTVLTVVVGYRVLDPATAASARYRHLATSLPVCLVGVAVGGVAQGIYLSVDLALIAEILPAAASAGCADLRAHSMQRDEVAEGAIPGSGG